MNDAHMIVSVRPCDLNIGSEYLNLNHVVRVKLEYDSKVKVWFADGKSEYFKGSKAEIIARWYGQNNVRPMKEILEGDMITFVSDYY